MISSSKIDTIIDTSKESIQLKLKPYRMVTYLILILTLVSLLELFNVSNILPNDLHFIAIIIAISSFIVAVSLYLIAHLTIQAKAFYKHVTPNALRAIALQEEMQMDVEAFPKTDKTINKEAGIFNRSASVSHVFKAKGRTRDTKNFELYLTRLLVSSGNSSHYVFRDLFYVFPSREPVHYQIRPKQKPTLKGVSYQKRDTEGKYTLFVQSNHDTTQKMLFVLKHVNHLHTTYALKNIFVSVTPNNTYIAIQSNDKLDRYRKITDDTVKEFTKKLHAHMKRIDELIPTHQ